MGGNHLIVFLRAPRLGTVKTRLAAALGEEAALSAYRELLTATLAAVTELSEVELRFSPDDARAEIDSVGQPGWTCFPQGGGDLGDRLIGAFTAGFAGGSGRIVAIGSDCPTLTAEDVRSAWLALEKADLVLGPAGDGGYWLIGLRQPQPELFWGMAWGGANVFDETLRRARLKGLQVHLLRPLQDVDTVEDWKAYLSTRREQG